MKKSVVSRPSLQSDSLDAPHCDLAAVLGCDRRIPGGRRGSAANSRDGFRASGVGTRAGCRDSRRRIRASAAATAAGAQAGIAGAGSSFAPARAGSEETQRRRRGISCLPWRTPSANRTRAASIIRAAAVSTLANGFSLGVHSRSGNSERYIGVALDPRSNGSHIRRSSTRRTFAFRPTTFSRAGSGLDIKPAQPWEHLPPHAFQPLGRRHRRLNRGIKSERRRQSVLLSSTSRVLLQARRASRSTCLPDLRLPAKA